MDLGYLVEQYRMYIPAHARLFVYVQHNLVASAAACWNDHEHLTTNSIVVIMIVMKDKRYIFGSWARCHGLTWYLYHPLDLDHDTLHGTSHVIRSLLFNQHFSLYKARRAVCSMGYWRHNNEVKSNKWRVFQPSLWNGMVNWKQNGYTLLYT